MRHPLTRAGYTTWGWGDFTISTVLKLVLPRLEPSIVSGQLRPPCRRVMRCFRANCAAYSVHYNASPGVAIHHADGKSCLNILSRLRCENSIV